MSHPNRLEELEQYFMEDEGREESLDDLFDNALLEDMVPTRGESPRSASTDRNPTENVNYIVTEQVAPSVVHAVQLCNAKRPRPETEPRGAADLAADGASIMLPTEAEALLTTRDPSVPT